MKRSQKGFSLIELLVVISIILIISAIAIPRLMVAKKAANEASAVQMLRTINNAQQTYATVYPSLGFSPNFTNLTSPSGSTSASSAAAGLLDNSWTGISTTRSGYVFALGNDGASPSTKFTALATPQTNGTGTRAYCLDDSSQVVYSVSTSPLTVANNSCPAVDGTTVLALGF